MDGASGEQEGVLVQVRRLDGIEEHLVAVVARTSRADDFDPRLAIEAAPDGWWYHAPLPAGQAIVAFLTDADLLPARRDLPEIWRRRTSG